MLYGSIYTLRRPISYYVMADENSQRYCCSESLTDWNCEPDEIVAEDKGKRENEEYREDETSEH